MNKKYDPTKTAMDIKTPSMSARILLQERRIFWLVDHGKTLDYGCGKLRNSRYMSEGGHNVDVFDLPEQIEKVRPESKGFRSVTQEEMAGQYDSVLCAFVLNTVTEDIREEILSDIKRAAKKDAPIVIEVRRTIDATNKEPYMDGFLVGTGSRITFQKPFEADDLLDLLQNNGLEVTEIIKRSHSVIAVAKKK